MKKEEVVSSTNRPLVVFIPPIDKQFQDHKGIDSSTNAASIVGLFVESKSDLLAEYGTNVVFVCGEEVAPRHDRKKFSHKESFETCIQGHVKNVEDVKNTVLVFYDVKLSKTQFATLIEAKGYSRPLVDAIIHFDGLPFHREPSSDPAEEENLEPDEGNEDYPLERAEEEEISSDGKRVDEDCVTGHNVAEYIAQKRIEKDGLWLDLTVDGIDASSLVIPIDPNAVAEPIPEPEPDDSLKRKKGKVVTPPPVVDPEELEERERQKALDTEAYEELCEKYATAMTVCKRSFCELLPVLLKKQAQFQTWALSKGELKKSSITFTPRVIYEAQKAAQDANQFHGNYDAESNWKSRPLYSRYLNEVNSLPINYQTCGGVLYSIVRTVVEDLPADKWEVAPLDIALTALGVRQIKMNHSETGELFSFSSCQMMATEFAPIPKDVCVCELGDSLMYRNVLCSETAPESEEDQEPVGLSPDIHHATLHGLSLFEKVAMYRLQIGRLIRSPAFPSVLPHSIHEIGTQETELLSFSSLTASDFYRADKLQKFNQLLDKCSVHLSDFTGSLALQKSGQTEDSATKRRYFRPISSLAFQQILSSQLLTEPDIVRHYYEKTDDLLMVLYWTPPARRIASRTWDPSVNIRLRISYMDYWKMVGKSNNEALPPPKPSLDVSASTLRSYPHNSVFITPAGKSMVFVHSLPKKKEFTWVSIFVDDCIIGLRRRESLNDIFGGGYIDMTDEEFHYDPAVRIKKNISKVISLGRVKNMQSGGGGLAALLPTVAKLKNEVFSVEPLDKLPTPRCTSASFFCENADQIRYVVTASEAAQLSTCKTKPDGFGTVCLSILFPVNNLRVAICSNGVIEMSATGVSAVSSCTKNGNVEDIGIEINRYICAAGTIVRLLAPGSLFSKDILHPDGARTLVRSTTDCEMKQNSKGFYGKLLSETDNWTYLRFNFDGTVFFYTGDVGGVNENGQAVETETLAEVRAYRDGRFIWKFKDNVMETVWPDGSRCVLSPSHTSYYITKSKFPSVEIDLLAERSSYGHAHGKQVPLAKSGPRVRSRIACADGTAVFVKYDVSVTAKINGSIKCVCRDRSRILASDDGNVSYLQRNSWNAQAEEDFRTDSQCAAGHETQAPPAADATNSQPQGTGGASLSGTVGKTKRKAVKSFSNPEVPVVVGFPKETTYSFNVNTLQCSIKDYEDNRFEIDIDSETPLEPKVDLAGELVGLKPIAVTDRPIEPKLYVVHRTADATEVVSNAALEDRKQLSKMLPDSTHSTVDSSFSPCDLGGAKKHTFLTKKHGGAAADGTFEDSFASPREWHARVRPAAVSVAMTLKDVAVVKSGSMSLAARSMSMIGEGRADPASSRLDTDVQEHTDCTRIFSKVSFDEFPPLSAEGYAQLELSLKSWEQFCEQRVININSFATVEKRPQAEVEVEEAMKLRIAAAYKNAKMQKLLRKRRAHAAAKEEARMKVIQEMRDRGEEILDAVQIPGVVAPKAKPAPAALDKIMEGDEDEESDSDYDSDDSDFFDEETPESIEMFAAFSEFSFTNEGQQYINLSDLRVALIQLINKKVSQETILDTFKLVDVDPDAECIDYDAFIDVIDCYKCISEGGVWGYVSEEEIEEEPHYLGDPHKLSLGLLIQPPKEDLYKEQMVEPSPLDVVTSSTQALVSKDGFGSPDYVVSNANTAATSVVNSVVPSTRSSFSNSNSDSNVASVAASVAASRKHSFSPGPASKGTPVTSFSRRNSNVTPDVVGKSTRKNSLFSPDVDKSAGRKSQDLTPPKSTHTPAGSTKNSPGHGLEKAAARHKSLSPHPKNTPAAGSAVNAIRRNFQSPVKKA